MNKSLKKLYEMDRKYDLAEWYTPVGRRFTKRRARRKARQILNRDLEMRAQFKGKNTWLPPKV